MLKSRSSSTETESEVAIQQREWFGRPLRELFGAVTDVGGLTQAQLGEALGISAPMVSQLMTGRRAKPGNPLVQERVIELARALDDFEAGRLNGSALRGVVDGLGGTGTAARSSLAPRSVGGSDPMAPAQFVRNLLSAVASAEEIEGAAKLLDKRYPELAELLRVHGTGRTSEAISHLQQHGLA